MDDSALSRSNKNGVFLLADTTNLEKGIFLQKDGKIWQVTDVFFVSPGKGAAFFRTKLKELYTGKVVENTIKSGSSIDIVELERRNCSFLYKEGEQYIFMDDATYEQHNLQKNYLSENMSVFLKPEHPVVIIFNEENQPIHASFIKTKMAFKVIEATPGVKGDTVSNVNRLVTLETGAQVQAPLFVKEGDSIVINVETGEYCERDRS